MDQNPTTLSFSKVINDHLSKGGDESRRTSRELIEAVPGKVLRTQVWDVPSLDEPFQLRDHSGSNSPHSVPCSEILAKGDIQVSTPKLWLYLQGELTVALFPGEDVKESKTQHQF